MTEGRGAVLVALCGRLGEQGLDPDPLRRGLEAAGLRAVVAEDLCGHLDLLPRLVEETAAGRAVLGVCARTSSADVQGAARAAGIDPFGAEAIDLPAAARLAPQPAHADRALLLLAARAAGLAALAPTAPGEIRMRLPEGPVSRRSLLSRGGMTYQPVAAIDASACLGTRRCGICVVACPVDAVEATRPKPTVVKDACVACGACLSPCPTRATNLAGAGLARVEAELHALLGGVGDGAAPGLLVTCGGWVPARDGEGPDLLPLAVPCLSMVSAGWLLQALAAGVPAVVLAGCGEKCRAGSRIGEIVDHCRRVLTSLGVPDGESRARVHTPENDDPPGALVAPLPRPLVAGPHERPVLGEPAATAAALVRLSGALSPGAHVPVGGGPLGRVRVETDRCTLCGLCASVCPTDALAYEQGPIVATLAYDPSRCVACEHCMAICPERVVTVEACTDLDGLREGARTMKADTLARCRRCGRPIAPDAMLRRIHGLLADAPEGLLASLRELCVDCRGSLTPT